MKRYKYRKLTVGDPPVCRWGKVPTDVCCGLVEELFGSVAFASVDNDAPTPPNENDCCCCWGGEAVLLFSVVDGIVSD